MLDITLFAIVTAMVLIPVNPDWFINANESLLVMLTICLWIVPESIILLVWGTTPGKLLFNIQLQKSDGTGIGRGEAFLRSFRVSWRGLALGIPLISFLTSIRAYDKLSRNGVTTWDLDGGYTVTHGPLRGLRLTLAVVTIVVFCVVYILDMFI